MMLPHTQNMDTPIPMPISRTLVQTLISGGQGVVYLDALHGTDTGDGSALHAVKTIEEAIAIAIAKGFRIIACLSPGAITMLADWTQSYVFIGLSQWIDLGISFGGSAPAGSIFYNTTVSGDCPVATDFFEAHDCNINALDHAGVYLWNCFLSGTNAVILINAFGLKCDGAILDLTALSDDGQLWDVDGDLTLTHLTAHTLTIRATGKLNLTIANSCTGGTIVIYGQNVTVTDSSAGTTVTRHDIPRYVTDAAAITANWNTATGTSGEAGEDLITLGANDVKNKLLSLVLNISALTVGALVTVKIFMQVNGVVRKVYSQVFLAGTDTDGLWIVQAEVGIHEALRVEVYSSVNESVAIHYDYLLEAL